jgi:hypothetical protein
VTDKEDSRAVEFITLWDDVLDPFPRDVPGFDDSRRWLICRGESASPAGIVVAIRGPNDHLYATMNDLDQLLPSYA